MAQQIVIWSAPFDISFLPTLQIRISCIIIIFVRVSFFMHLHLLTSRSSLKGVFCCVVKYSMWGMYFVTVNTFLTRVKHRPFGIGKLDTLPMPGP